MGYTKTTTKHYIAKKIVFTIFGSRYYHHVKALKILFDYLVGKDYDDIYLGLSKFLNKSDVVLDIGANMGNI